MHVPGGIGYNLKKYLKYMKNIPESIAGMLCFIGGKRKDEIGVIIKGFKLLIF